MADEIQTIEGLPSEGCSRKKRGPPEDLLALLDDDRPIKPARRKKARPTKKPVKLGGLHERPKWLVPLIIIGGLVLLIGGGAVYVVSGKTIAERLRSLLPLAQRVAAKYGIPVSWLLAFGRQESAFDPLAVAGAGTADARRGGSFGIMQMSLKTAVGLGYRGPTPDLSLVSGSKWIGEVPKGHILDPEVNLDLAGRLLSQLRAQYGDNLLDIAAAYNSGRPYGQVSASVTYADRVSGFQQGYASLDAAQAPSEGEEPEV